MTVVLKERGSLYVTPLAGICKPVLVPSPSACGPDVATFTHGLAGAIDAAAGEVVSAVANIDNGINLSTLPDGVTLGAGKWEKDAYLQLADFCNLSSFTHVSLQHGGRRRSGNTGQGAVRFSRACKKPVVTTLHTVSTAPDTGEWHTMRELARLSEALVVGSNSVSSILKEVYGVTGDKVRCVPQEIDGLLFHPNVIGAGRFASDTRPVLLTYGPVTPDTGIQYMIEALPAVLEHHSGATCVVLGQKSSPFKKHGEEGYLRRLRKKAERLGVGGHVRFEYRFIPLLELLRHICRADILVSLHVGRNRQDHDKDVLMYALESGTPVVSTPFPYAEEMFGRGALCLTNAGCSRHLAGQVLRILGSAALRRRLRENGLKATKEREWNRIGREYYDLFSSL